MHFCRLVFLIATAYGVLMIVPLYFAEGLASRLNPPEITQPVYYYGFIGGALAWQFVYFLVAVDPLRLRPFIVLSALAKLALVVTVACLLYHGRVSWLFATAVGGDLVLALLFLHAYRLVRNLQA
jgi:hypothetical protein